MTNAGPTRRDYLRYGGTAVGGGLLDTIESGLPPKADRPTVGYVQIATDLSAVYVLRLNAPGYYNAHTRPLGAVDAFGDVEIQGEFAEVDFEAVLDADPDVLLTVWGMTSKVDFERMRSNLSKTTRSDANSRRSRTTACIRRELASRDHS